MSARSLVYEVGRSCRLFTIQLRAPAFFQHGYSLNNEEEYDHVLKYHHVKGGFSTATEAC